MLHIPAGEALPFVCEGGPQTRLGHKLVLRALGAGLADGHVLVKCVWVSCETEQCEMTVKLEFHTWFLLPLHALSSLSMKWKGPQSDLHALQNSVLKLPEPLHMLLVSTNVPLDTSLQHSLPWKMACMLAVLRARS